jgi:hypothetical protein
MERAVLQIQGHRKWERQFYDHCKNKRETNFLWEVTLLTIFDAHKIKLSFFYMEDTMKFNQILKFIHQLRIFKLIQFII